MNPQPPDDLEDRGRVTLLGAELEHRVLQMLTLAAFPANLDVGQVVLGGLSMNQLLQRLKAVIPLVLDHDEARKAAAWVPLAVEAARRRNDVVHGLPVFVFTGEDDGLERELHQRTAGSPNKWRQPTTDHVAAAVEALEHALADDGNIFSMFLPDV